MALSVAISESGEGMFSKVWFSEELSLLHVNSLA